VFLGAVGQVGQVGLRFGFLSWRAQNTAKQGWDSGTEIPIPRFCRYLDDRDWCTHPIVG
jgi:hypothetical protein